MEGEDYNKAFRLGKRDYQARMHRGVKPTLLVLDDIIPKKERIRRSRSAWCRFRLSRS